jgi:8-oxo-dGTP pyrophosphatase MutT (NUDIX family)
VSGPSGPGVASEGGDVPVRDAATVALLRDGMAGIEVWLLTRVTQMVFAAGMSVFPGGRVDTADADLPFVAGSEQLTADRFACTPEMARALVGAAVRETFEETGVLLTSPPSAALADAREDVEAGRLAFGTLLREHGLTVDADALRPWARWVTPAGEVRRYDTRFFVGALPAGAEALDVTTESSSGDWVRAGEAMEQAQRGERGLMAPTLATLASLVPFASVAEVFEASAQRSLAAVRPTLDRRADGGYDAVLPDGSRVPLPASLIK